MWAHIQRSLCFASVLGCLPVAMAALQCSTVNVDGQLKDVDNLDTVSQTSATNSLFGTSGDLLALRISNNDAFLFLGLACRLPSSGPPAGVWIWIDSRAGGMNTVRTGSIPAASPLLHSLDGVVLEREFNADFVVTLDNSAAPKGLQYYEVTLVDLNRGTTVRCGTLDVTTGVFLPSDKVPYGLAVGFDPGETTPVAQAAQATKGLEMRLPLALLGTSRLPTSTIKAFVGNGRGDTGYWSNQTLPPSVTPENAGSIGGGSGAGTDAPNRQPNFAANQRGAGSTAFPLVGDQGFTSAVPVSVTTFLVE